MPPQDAYFESQILTADPVELVRILYRAARAATRQASVELAAGRIAERSRAICKAHAILTELATTLDHARGGALSGRLAELYDYLQRRLLEANQKQKAAPLAEVERLLGTLLEGWEQVGQTAPAVPEPAREPARISQDCARAPEPEYGGHAPHPAFLPEPTSAYASQSWSF
ncbi:MAG TPA: flagellar export chaperone FliS [Bryobacteraceae bacterium]|nr:flagellar export chaperone FliS [Bryobacteraceae bacterium]